MFANYKAARSKTSLSSSRLKNPPPAFGEAMRKREFTLDDDVTFLNHGSFGAVPKMVKELQEASVKALESNPDLHLRRTMSQYWVSSLQRIAPFLGSDPNNLAFVESATSGISNVLRSIPFSNGDVILYNNFTFDAVKNAIDLMKDINTGLETHEIMHTLPIASSDVIVQQYEEALNEHPNIKVAVIDHIAQFGLLFPVKRLTDLCKSRGVLVLIDGAHCPGQVPLDLETLAADFYIGNLHKWVFAARGCAIQWVAPQNHDMMKPAIVSANIKAPYPVPFFWQGTRDPTAYAAVPAIMDFLEWIGGMDAQHEYAEMLFSEGIPILTEAWGTKTADIPEDMQCPYMRLVTLPEINTKQISEEDKLLTENDLYDQFKIWSVIVSHAGIQYIRVCVNIYVTIDDFKKLKDAVLSLMPPNSKA